MPRTNGFPPAFPRGISQLSYADRQFCNSAANLLSAFCLTISFYLTYKNFPTITRLSELFLFT